MAVVYPCEDVKVSWAAPATASELREDLAAGFELCGFRRPKARSTAGLDPYTGSPYAIHRRERRRAKKARS